MAKDDPKNQAFAERLEQRLRAMGYWKDGRIDKIRFATEHGFVYTYVDRWLKGEIPSVPYFLRLADAIGMEPKALYNGEDHAHPTKPGRAPKLMAVLASAGLAASTWLSGPAPAWALGVSRAQPQRETQDVGSNAPWYLTKLDGLPLIGSSLARLRRWWHHRLWLYPSSGLTPCCAC